MIDISILMAIHNPNKEYLIQSLDSIEQQSFKNFELVIIDDCTININLKKILSNYNFRYTIYKNETNLGLTKSLNKGIFFCNGKYIARFDDDDILKNTRLEEQFLFLEKNLDYAAVFSNIEIIDNNKIVCKEIKDDNNVLRKKLLYKGNCLCHSSLMIRKDIIMKLKYDEKMIYAQDYDLILRLLINKYKIYKIPKILVTFRLNSCRINIEKKFLSTLLSYFATLKYLSYNFSLKIFILRTIIIVKYVIKLLLQVNFFKSK